jgi:DNA phosphorothioation-dependent restriction protein DptH
MISLGRALRREIPQGQIHVLDGNKEDAGKDDIFISSTKLVELRNPLPDGTQRAPLLVFLPPNLHTNAEDSFNVASFEEIAVTHIYDGLAKTLLESTPVARQGHVREMLLLLVKEGWSWADKVAQARFLLTAVRNGIDDESLGAALYELGLVPDFHLFKDTTISLHRLRKNLDSVRKLTHSDQSVRGRVLALELADRTTQRRLTDFLIETGVDDPRLWTRKIVLERKNWDISFDKWQFKEESYKDKVFVHILQTDLPTVKEDETEEKLQNLVGQQVLVPKNRRQLKVEFEVEPHPQQIQGLSYFTVQIVAKEGGSVGSAKKVKVWKTKSSNKSVTLDKLHLTEFEEGWHFIRVLPWTDEGDAIPLAERGETLSSERTSPHESELFYVLPESSLEDEPPQRAIPQEPSLEHARLKLQFNALAGNRDPDEVQVREVVWTDKNVKSVGAAQPALEARFGKNGSIRIPVAGRLQELEMRILSDSEKILSWRLKVNMNRVAALTAEPLELQKSASLESFLAARKNYFDLVRGEDGNLITQAVDPHLLGNACADYAAAYRDLLGDLRAKIERSNGIDQQRLIVSLRSLMSLDSVRIVVADFKGRAREAAIISPTHPLRALWFVVWSRVARHWLQMMKDRPDEYTSAVRDSVLQKLAPVNFPPVLPIPDGRIFLAVDQIHPLWALYAPAKEEDARGLLGEVCVALGLPEPAIGGVALTGEIIASRIERYISQHPYINTLSLNAFNPGRGAVLADALLSLQKRELTSDLHYDVRLFVPDPEAPGVGENIEQLLSPTGTISAEADAFSISSGNHLFPKLNFAVHQLNDFTSQPAAYEAHISLLFDLFPPEEIATGKPFQDHDAAPLHGLVQDFVSKYSEGEDGSQAVMWQRQPRHGEAATIPDSEVLIDLLAGLPADFSGAASTVALDMPAFEQRPIVTLTLDAEQRALLHNIHGASDWVFTIDRNLGIEFFDHGGERERPPYLVDYVPSETSDSGHRLIITSLAVAELQASLRHFLKQYGINADERHAILIMKALRSLSGRLALKFVSSHTHQAEALGLALAKLFLEQQGALTNQLIIPFDAHLDLFRAVKLEANEAGETWNLKRTDLALFDLDAEARIVKCNLVEIKFYKRIGSLADYQKLKESIATQIEQSEEVIKRHFDTTLKTPDRPDRLLKTRELATLLRFYLERAQRYGLIEENAATETERLLADLEEGYTLSFTKSAIIFDYDSVGISSPEIEDGIEFHRLGSDITKALLIETIASEARPEDSEGTSESTIPLLSSAAFIAPRRSRSHEPMGSGLVEDVRGTHESKHDADADTSMSDKQPESFVEIGTSSKLEDDESKHGVDTNHDIPMKVDNEPPAVIQVPQPESSVIVTPPDTAGAPDYGVMLGVQGKTPQYGVIGEASGWKVALDLNQTHTISLFGVQGGGKSYTLGTIVETACVAIPNINLLPNPLATVIFHYSPTQDYKPEFTSMIYPNTDAEQVASLSNRYGAEPRALEDILILVPASKVEERQAEYPNIEVLPITFAASELKAAHWKFLMGAVGSQSMYLRQINLIMRKMRETLTLSGILQAVEDSPLSDHLKDLARTRLQFAAEYIDDSRSRLMEIVRPGRLIIVDLRDEFIEKDEALGLFVVLLQLFAEATFEGKTFNKLVVFDEAHKYIESQDLVAGLIEVVREMRHKGTSILIASQDPPSVPTPLIELSSQIILHKFNSPAWLRHIQKANASLNELTAEKMARLSAGEAYVWSSKASDDGFTRGAIRIKCRPRVTQHGGSTKTAVTTFD